ncbi:hypothetical protein [Photobacterium damselae]|uniref:hypothetical protein n=1 Tax=Photobacterium damselae TaxID=38293 RepID=UPI0040688C3E
MKRILYISIVCMSFSASANYADDFTKICADAITKINADRKNEIRIQNEFFIRAKYYSSQYYSKKKLSDNDIKKISDNMIDSCKNYPYMKVDTAAAQAVRRYFKN